MTRSRWPPAPRRQAETFSRCDSCSDSSMIRVAWTKRQRAHIVSLAWKDGACHLTLALVCAVSRSEEHTSELQSLMRISYAVFCLKKKNKTVIKIIKTTDEVLLQSS